MQNFHLYIFPAELVYLFVIDAVVLSQREVECIAQRGVVHCFLTNEITAS